MSGVHFPPSGGVATGAGATPEAEGWVATIAVIEDERELRTLLRGGLEGAGHNVIMAEDGPGGVVLVEREEPDLVILDVMMPDISGLDILRKMRLDPALAHIPVVVVSAKGTPTDIKTGMDAGASTYLTKPVGFLELKEAVDRALSG